MRLDETIWKSIAEGDETAYEVMYKHYYKRFYAYGFKVTPHTILVEDSIQEVMIYIWQNRHKLYTIKNPAGYIFTFFRNNLYRKLKEIQPEEYDSDYDLSDGITPEESIITKETVARQNRQILNAIATLTPRQQEAIHLRFFEELSYQEIADMMGITVKAMYKLMARSLSILKNNYGSIILIITLLYL